MPDTLKIFTHDVLNSLTKIILTLKLAEKESEIERLKKKLNTCLNLALECAEFCKVTANKPDFVEFYSDTFFKGFISEQKQVYDNLSITFYNEKNIHLNADINLLRNALGNMIKNSLEAGATKIVIKTEEGLISFVDNGRGISRERANVIKERGTTKEDEKNHGIGLLSLSHFCKSNNWSLRFRNNLPSDHFPTGFTVEFVILTLISR
jgi:signal transduction histidine kinase